MERGACRFPVWPHLNTLGGVVGRANTLLTRTSVKYRFIRNAMCEGSQRAVSEYTKIQQLTTALFGLFGTTAAAAVLGGVSIALRWGRGGALG